MRFKTRQRKPKGSRRPLRLVGAGLSAALAGGASWQVVRLDRPGIAILILAASLAVPAGLLARCWWQRTPFDIPARLPRHLSTSARVRWLERPFLGWSRTWYGWERWAMGTFEDSVGVIGPPRVSKTLSAGVPQVLLWGGPLVSIAPKPDVFRASAGRRRQLTDRHGGQLLVYAPTEDGLVEGLQPCHFSPADSKDPTTIKLRIASWQEAAKTSLGVENANHWQTGGARILRGLFLACAHHRVRPGDFALVRSWLARRQLEEPIQILRGLHSYAGDQWAAELDGVRRMEGSKERDGFFSAAEVTVDATSAPNVLRSTDRTDFDPERFLLTRSTLYVVSPTEHQRSIAPLLAMLVQDLVHTAYRLHREGRLPARLLLALDDLANCCPLPQLESICSQGGGQGVNVCWSLQSLAQLRDPAAYGEEQAEAIWSATRCKLVFGGLSDERSLARLAELIQLERVHQRQHGQDGKVIHSESWRPLLTAAQLREVPDRWALLLYLNQPPRMLRQPLALNCRQFRALMKPLAEPKGQVKKTGMPARGWRRALTPLFALLLALLAGERF
ncbi:type IV secretory system conjugative DNA transfer family protein [Candidatus Nephthysia bennettiae]|uniref:Type IV secretory system conjugative DNA transfer family protein n=1 Tax=Candidatus Nephthysia bennettiae TaxID=3127016 RepID=A0A934N258_9BACT|nr:type IV secretory system conjugative DNA transfer family protein [Candidatus Dormibacteraeota bacterium]